MARADDLVVDPLAELIRSLVTGVDLTDFLHRLADHARTLLAADAVAVMLADARGELQVLAAAGDDPSCADLFELDARSGPGAVAYRRGEVVTAVDVDAVLESWPEFGRRLGELDLASAQAVPLALGTGTIGALSVLRPEGSAISGVQLTVARMLADVAAVAFRVEPVATAQLVLARELRRALQSRVLIEQAKGMLAQRAGVDVDIAFARMRASARDTDRPLRDVAAGVIAGRGHLD